jgi:hypothetical protein
MILLNGYIYTAISDINVLVSTNISLFGKPYGAFIFTVTGNANAKYTILNDGTGGLKTEIKDVHVQFDKFDMSSTQHASFTWIFHIIRFLFKNQLSTILSNSTQTLVTNIVPEYIHTLVGSLRSIQGIANDLLYEFKSEFIGHPIVKLGSLSADIRMIPRFEA